MKIFPAKDASDKRIQTYNFIQAVTQLPSAFAESEIDDLLNRISPNLHGRLKSILVGVTDDMLKKRSKPKPAQSKSASQQKSKSAGKGTKTPETVRTQKRGASGSPEDSGPSAKK